MFTTKTRNSSELYIYFSRDVKDYIYQVVEKWRKHPRIRTYNQHQTVRLLEIRVKTGQFSDTKHCPPESEIGNEKFHNHHLFVDWAATEFPRSASSRLSREQESFDAGVDFSVEKAILKRQHDEIKPDKAEKELNNPVHYKYSVVSIFDDDEIKIVRGLREVDWNEFCKKNEMLYYLYE